MHQFLLEIVNSMQIVSVVLVSKVLRLFSINPCLIKTILPLPLAFLSFLKRGNRYPSILNLASGKLLPNLVQSMHKTSAFLIFHIELKIYS